MNDDRIRRLFGSLLGRFAGAIEFWPVACLSRGDLGDPAGLVESQCALFRQDIQDIREELAARPDEPPAVVSEQIARLLSLAGELRDLFAVFLDHVDRPREEIELAVLGLGQLWKDLRTRLTLTAAALRLTAPLPAITVEQEAYYQGLLDGLFDRFTTEQ